MIKVTVYFKDDQFRELPPYTLTLTDPISNPGGVAVTQIIKLKQRSQVAISEPEFQGQLTVLVEDIHAGSRGFNLKVLDTRTSNEVASLRAGPKVHFPFRFNGTNYVLEGYTKTDIIKSDYLFFKIYRMASR
jgi:hypothetical protein